MSSQHTAGCLECMFWVRIAEGVGHCHRYPPALIKMGGEETSFFPETADDDWCGEYREGTTTMPFPVN